MQRCYRCKVEKSDDAFIRRIDDRHYGMCRVCVSEILSLRSKGKIRLSHTATHRIRYLCRRTLSNSGFTRRPLPEVRNRRSRRNFRLEMRIDIRGIFLL